MLLSLGPRKRFLLEICRGPGTQFVHVGVVQWIVGQGIMGRHVGLPMGLHISAHTNGVGICRKRMLTGSVRRLGPKELPLRSVEDLSTFCLN